MRSGPYTGGAVLLPWDAIDMRTRRRLLAAQPIAAERRRVQTFAMFAIACACGFALVMLSGYGFGRVDEAWLVERAWLVFPYGALLAGIIVPSAWLARRVLSAGAWFPYGRALLQLDALEHTGKGLVVRPFGDARHAVIERGFVELQYVDGSTFRVRTELASGVLNVAIENAETLLGRASLSDDRSERDAIDPLTALRDARGFAPNARTEKTGARATRDRTAWMFVPLAIASFAGAWPLLGLRNRASDDAAFAYAHHENVRVHYETYVGSGGTRHAREVNEEILPRLVLDDAKVHGDPTEIAAMIERFPGSRVDAEARTALGASCDLAAENKIRGSYANLFDDLAHFVKDHPECKPQLDGISSRFFTSKRAELRANRDVEPALRDMILTLLDRAERTHTRARFRLVINGELGARVDAVNWALAESMRRFVGSAIEVLTYPTLPVDGDRLEIALSSPSCPPGTRTNNLRAHFELRGGESRADWWRLLDDDYSLFLAATTREDAKLRCVPERKPTVVP